MKLIDTTDRRSEVGVRSLISCSQAEQDGCLAGKFRIHLRGFFSATVGVEWDSKGRRESDFLHHIEMPLSGTRSIIHRGEVYDLEPGDIWFLPGNTPVIRQCSRTCDLLFFKLSCEWLPGVDPLLDWKERGPRKIGSFQIAEWLPWRKANRKYSMSDLLVLRATLLSWLAQSLPELDEVIRSHLATHMQFSKAFSLMESQLGADLRLSALADAQGLSIDAFSAAFTRNIGMGPKEYMSRRINEKALILVTYSDMKMKQVAETLRFSDEFYFSRFFKKMNGKPPSIYREEMRKTFADGVTEKLDSFVQG